MFETQHSWKYNSKLFNVEFICKMTLLTEKAATQHLPGS